MEVERPLRLGADLLPLVLTVAGTERGLKAPLSPHESATFRRIALGISEAKLLPLRDVDYLIRLRLVDENEGRLRLTAFGRERYHGPPLF
jgi:hypothetical protein